MKKSMSDRTENSTKEMEHSKKNQIEILDTLQSMKLKVTLRALTESSQSKQEFLSQGHGF